MLVVEDDRALLELLLDYFESEKVEVIAAEDAAQALAKLAEDPLPDVVLLDLRLPEVSGEELLARMRADPRLARLPVALMSGDPGRLALTRAEGLPQLAKPFSIDELDAALALHCAELRDGDGAAP